MPTFTEIITDVWDIITNIFDLIKNYVINIINYLPSELSIFMVAVVSILLVIFIYRFLK